MDRFALTSVMAIGLVSGLFAGSIAQLPDPLPRPDGKPADSRKPVQVYILMGQSNMLGFGKVNGLADACKNKGLYPYLVDESGNWTVRKDVRYVRVMCSGSGPSKTYNNEWMTISGKIGPEIGIGHYVGHVTKAPVLILKSCIGNRSLGYDLLPPSADGYEGNPRPPRKPKSGPWYAGVQYDGDVAAAKKVLANLGKHYPGAKQYEVAGFFWWQGDKDFRNAEHAANYEKNLLCLIQSLRKDFDAPNAKFVCATLGQTKKGAGGPQGEILEATLNIDGERGKYRSHRGRVASIYSHPLSLGGSSSGHYGGNAETYMNVGQAMGQAMARLIMNSPAGVPGVDVDQLDGVLEGVHNNIVAGKRNRADKSIRAYLAAASGKAEEQLGLARKLRAHLAKLVDQTIQAMRDCKDRGDYCQLRDELVKNGKSHHGIPAYDRAAGAWAVELATEKAVRELAVGDLLEAIIARKKRTREGVFFGQIVEFQRQHPESYYASQAEAAIEPTRAALRETFAEIAAYEKLGDLRSKFDAIQRAKERFAQIPEFDEACTRWSTEAKDPEVKASITAGAAYEAVFASLSKLDARLAKAQAKNRKITGRNKRTKAEEKAKADYQRRLKSLATRLEKLASKYAGSYYGTAAARSHKVYVDSQGHKLSDQRQR